MRRAAAWALAALALCACAGTREAAHEPAPGPAPADARASGSPPASVPVPAVSVHSEFGAESDWVRPLLERACATMVRLMDARDVAPPASVAVVLEREPGSHGVAGWASPTRIGMRADGCPRDVFRVWILTHELANLFAAHYGGAGGFPSDWWSNGRSPFPVYLCGLVLRELGEDETADWLRASYAGQPDHELYWELHERFGFALFARTLALLRADGVDLGAIEPPWPHPSATRSAYTVAYLSLAAGEDLTDAVAAAGVGREPEDWRQVHPEIPFEEYALSVDEVAAIQAVREYVFQPGGPEELRDRYRAGRWQEVVASVEILER